MVRAHRPEIIFGDWPNGDRRLPACYMHNILVL